MCSWVTVVIPVFNAEMWIEETLNSVLNQSYCHQNLQIIIIDDGSTDTSMIIAESVVGSCDIEYLILKTRNNGVSHARNLGIKHAKGQWIQFLDADDLLHPSKIWLQFQCAQKCSEEVALVYSSWQHLLPGPKGGWLPNSIVQVPSFDDPPIDVFGANNFMQLGAGLFRREWLEKVDGFDERIEIIQDVHLLFKLAINAGKFFYCPSLEPLLQYRQHTNSLSRRDTRRFITECLNNISQAENWMVKTQSLNEYRRVVLIDTYAYIASASYSVYMDLFEVAVEALDRLSAPRRYIPKSPLILVILAQLLGYRKAEFVRSRVRVLKTYLLRTTNIVLNTAMSR